jgi:hypothetical protein
MNAKTAMDAGVIFSLSHQWGEGSRSARVSMCFGAIGGFTQFQQ